MMDYATLIHPTGLTQLISVSDKLMQDIAKKGLDSLTNYPQGDLGFFRPFEWVAALNRLRSLRIDT